MRASMFSRSVEERDTAAQTFHPPFRVWLKAGVTTYTADERAALVEDPASFEYKTYKFKPAKSLKVHATWAQFCAEAQTMLWESALRAAT